MLPIEEGCLAMVVRSAAGNAGKVVTVGRYIGKVPLYDGYDRWSTEEPLRGVYTSGAGAEYVYHATQSQLMRIDGGESEEEETQELALVLVNSGDNRD